MNIIIGADHAGFTLKEKFALWLKKKGHKITDISNKTRDVNDDYPDISQQVAQKVAKTKSKGILICGTGIGVCIVANKIRGIRAVAAPTPLFAKLSRQDEDTNILCLAGADTKKHVPGLHHSITQAKAIVHIWLTTRFSNATRHIRRINEIKKLEQ